MNYNITFTLNFKWCALPHFQMKKVTVTTGTATVRQVGLLHQPVPQQT